MYNLEADGSAEAEENEKLLIERREEDEDEMEALKELSILKAIIESCDEALVNIERDAIQEKEREIREELFMRQLSIDPASSISLQAKEEINLYVQFWQRHLDILQCQEALLHESLGNKGYDSSSFSAYDSRQVAWTGAEEPDTELAWRDITWGRASSASSAQAMLPPLSSYSRSDTVCFGTTGDSNRSTDIDWFEEFVEEDCHDRLPALQIASEADDVILQYAD